MGKSVECSICFHMCNHCDKKPKILSCGHTFCVTCLMTLVQGQILTCPECRQNTTITGTPNELVTNFGLQDVAEKACREWFVHPWSEQCVHCQENLCSNCHKNHEQQSLDEVIEILNDRRRKVECMKNKFQDIQQIKDKCASVKSDVTSFWKEQLRKMQQNITNDTCEIGLRESRLLLAYETWQKICNAIADETMNQIDTFLDNVKQKITHKEILNMKEDLKGLAEAASAVYAQESSVTELNVNLSHEELEVYLATVGVLGRSWSNNTQEDIDRSLSTSETPPSIFHQRRFVNQQQCWWLAALVPLVITLVLVAWTYRSPACETNYSTATYIRSVGKTGTGPGEFNHPYNVAISPITGNIFVTDFGNSNIQIFTKDFQFISMLSSGDTLGMTQMSNPTGIAIHSKGEVFISQPDRQCILVLDEDRKWLNTITLEGLPSENKYTPYILSVDKDDNVYICDVLNYRIIVMTADGTVVRQFGTHGTQPGQFVSIPHFITVSVDGLVAVSDYNGHIYLFTTHGNHMRTIKAGQSGSFNDASGITFDTNGNLIVADYKDGKLYVMTKEGEVVATVGPSGDDQMPLMLPTSVALTLDGYIVVCDIRNRQLHIFNVQNCFA